MKVRARCHLLEPREDFYVHKKWRDGRHPYCKPCLLAYQQRRRFEKRDAERPGRRQWTRRFVRHDYFREMRSPKQAYVLGFLAADGNVFGSRVSLKLAEKDKEIAAFVRDELASEVRLRARRRGSRDMVLFSASSRELADDLASLGVTERKSKTLRWPARLPDSLARPFLLGYFDGDGLVTWSRYRRYAYPRWGLIGTKSFLTSAAALLEDDPDSAPVGSRAARMLEPLGQRPRCVPHRHRAPRRLRLRARPQAIRLRLCTVLRAQ